MIVDIHKPDTSTLVTTGHFYFGWTVPFGGIASPADLEYALDSHKELPSRFLAG